MGYLKCIVACPRPVGSILFLILIGKVACTRHIFFISPIMSYNAYGTNLEGQSSWLPRFHCKGIYMSESANTQQHKHTNRLINETSPYLLQHAHNPVDWYPWGEEALEKAKKEDKPVLVSIGYAACHWCHVMERESFENEETARLMNEHFINIKIDREELLEEHLSFRRLSRFVFCFAIITIPRMRKVCNRLCLV